MKIAVIGTAGRDRNKPMTLTLWNWMIADAIKRIPTDSHLVSGGAAWADHVAVELYMRGHVNRLTLHLPAPMDIEKGIFIGPYKSAASAANYYHQQFSEVIGLDSRRQIILVSQQEKVDGSFEPEAPGYAAMFARNRKVAQAEGMLAYTFGSGDIPADGGTKNTWDLCQSSRKVHVPLPIL